MRKYFQIDGFSSTLSQTLAMFFVEWTSRACTNFFIFPTNLVCWNLDATFPIVDAQVPNYFDKKKKKKWQSARNPFWFESPFSVKVSTIFKALLNCVPLGLWIALSSDLFFRDFFIRWQLLATKPKEIVGQKGISL